MNCPNCASHLNATTYEGQAIYECLTCRGRFVGQTTLKAILESESAPRSEAEHQQALHSGGSAALLHPDERPVRSCPQCTAEMRRIVHAYDSGVWVDTCADHGVWLDVGELERLEAMAEAVRRGGRLEAPQRSNDQKKERAFLKDSDYYGLNDRSGYRQHSSGWGGFFDSIF